MAARLVTVWFVITSSAFALDWEACLINLTNGQLRLTNNLNDSTPIGLGYDGLPTLNDSAATAISYLNCVAYCPGGDTPEPVKWNTVVQLFSSWLLPWLALMSQLPYGAAQIRDNIMALALTIGSPALAAYSLIITALNTRYVASKFSTNPISAYPNAKAAATILAGLQQLPLEVDDCLLASLVVLPQNDWWWKLVEALTAHEYKWTTVNIIALIWVVVAYFLSTVSAFLSLSEIDTGEGPGLGSLWLWLLPIVIGWMFVSPNCDAVLRDALHTANNTAAHYAGQREQETEETHAVNLKQRNQILLYDESCSPPIFNYTRIFSWSRCVDKVANTFAAAAGRAARRIPVNLSVEWRAGEAHQDPLVIHPDNRMGTQSQIFDYCISSKNARNARLLETISRIVVASCLALILQWCTVGASAFVAWHTPTTGLGCYSGSYLLYGVASTSVWFFLVLSSILGHLSFGEQTVESKVIPMATDIHLLRVQPRHPVAILAIVLNSCGKVLAILNAAWIICLSILQISNIYQNCYCSATVIGRGVDRAYVQLVQTDQSLSDLTNLWKLGVCVSTLVAASFVTLVWLCQRSSYRLLC